MARDRFDDGIFTFHEQAHLHLLVWTAFPTGVRLSRNILWNSYMSCLQREKGIHSEEMAKIHFLHVLPTTFDGNMVFPMLGHVLCFMQIRYKTNKEER